MQQNPQVSAGAFIRFSNLTINLLYVETIEITDNDSVLEMYYTSGRVQRIVDKHIIAFFKQYNELMPDMSIKEICIQYFEMVMNKMRSDFPMGGQQQPPQQKRPPMHMQRNPNEQEPIDMQSHNGRFSDFPHHLKETKMAQIPEGYEKK